jgi:uncharacterized protein YjbJ (UPF0337 family)
MNQDELKGKGKDMIGRVQRQVGEWTGDEESQVKGAGKQVEGKGQNVLGKIKKAGSDLKDDLQGKDDERAEDRDGNRRDVA